MRLHYVKIHCVYKRSMRPHSIGFLFGCDSGYICDMASNEELAKAFKDLTETIKSIQTKW